MESNGSRAGAGSGLSFHGPLLSHPSFLRLQLARAGAVGSQGAKLLLEVSERVRTLTQAYFSPERPLHLSFTHLVCRSAIEGNRQGPQLFLPNLEPLLGTAHPQQPPHSVGFLTPLPR